MSRRKTAAETLPDAGQQDAPKEARKAEQKAERKAGETAARKAEKKSDPKPGRKTDRKQDQTADRKPEPKAGSGAGPGTGRRAGRGIGRGAGQGASDPAAERGPERGPIHPEPFLDVPDAEIVEHRPGLLHPPAAPDLTPDPALLERSRAHWQMGDWERLAALASLPLEDHPDRAKLALLAGVGLAQTGDMSAARVQVRRAQGWGCPRDLVARVLVAGVHNSLGRMASLHGDEARALRHFETSVGTVSPRADAQVLGRARNIHEKARLGQLPQAAALLDSGLTEARRDPAPGRETLEHLAGGLALLQIEVEALRQKRRAAPGAVAAHPLDQSQAQSQTHPQTQAPPLIRRSRVAPPFVVAVAGVPRSGSTWVYNAVRLLCAGNGLSYHAGWHADYDPAAHRAADLHVIKLHDPVKLDFPVHRILTSQRDLVERLASHVRMGWTKPDPEAIRASARRMAELAEYWADRSNHETRFADILDRPQEVVQAIAAATDLPCDVALARRIAAELAALPEDRPDALVKVDGHAHNPETLLHPGHRASTEDRDQYLTLVRTALAQRPQGERG